MSAAAGPFAIAAVLLVLGGLAKAWQPSDTAKALRSAGVPASGAVTRVGAIAEAALGAYALVDGGRVAAILVAASYLGFAAFVGFALVRDLPLATCGCFGKADTPPDALHLGINLAAVGAAVAVAFDPGVGVRAVADQQPWAAVPYFALVALGVCAALLSLTSLARVQAMVRGGAA